MVRREDRYMIIAGERRWRACNMAGIEEVPVRILDADNRKIAELSLLEKSSARGPQRDRGGHGLPGAHRHGHDDGGNRHQDGNQAELADPGAPEPPETGPGLSGLHGQGDPFPFPGPGAQSAAEESAGHRLRQDRLREGEFLQQAALPGQRDALRSRADELPSGAHRRGKEDEQQVRHHDRTAGDLHQPVLQTGRSYRPCFDPDPKARINIERIDSIIYCLNKIKKALLQAESTREVYEQKSMEVH